MATSFDCPENGVAGAQCVGSAAMMGLLSRLSMTGRD
jgi:hypothetical protein